MRGNSPHLEKVCDKEFINLVWELTEDALAEYVKKSYDGTMYYSAKSGWWSLRKNNTWENKGTEPENIRTRVVNVVMKDYREMLEKLKNQNKEEEEEDEGDRIFIERMKKLTLMVKTNRTYKGFLAFLMEKMSKNDIDNLIDQSHDLFAFEDKVLDTTTDSLRDIEPDDWISQTTGYEYGFAGRKYIKELEEILKDIMGDLYEYVMTATSLVLCGRRRTSDILTLLGEGGNGKSVFVGCILQSLGKLACSAPIGLFTSQLTSRNPELLMLKGKRFVVVNEPERQKSVSTLVKMLDGDKICVRDNYTTSKEVQEFSATFGLWFLCNDPPKFDGDGGIRRRLRCALFKNTYREKPVGDEKQADPLIKERLENDPNLRNAFIHLLRGYYHSYQEAGYKFDTPNEVMETASEVIEGGNPVAEWFNDNFVRTGDPTDRIEKRDLYERHYSIGVARPISRNAFSMAVKHLNIKIQKSNGVRYWVGIKRFQPDPEPETPESVGSTLDPGCLIKD